MTSEAADQASIPPFPFSNFPSCQPCPCLSPPQTPEGQIGPWRSVAPAVGKGLEGLEMGRETPLNASLSTLLPMPFRETSQI